MLFSNSGIESENSVFFGRKREVREYLQMTVEVQKYQRGYGPMRMWL